MRSVSRARAYAMPCIAAGALTVPTQYATITRMDTLTRHPTILTLQEQHWKHR